jgi:hypothetical protein
MMGGIPERGAQGRSLSVDDLRPLLPLGLGLAGMARFMRGLRDLGDLGDRVADVLDRHDRFHRGGHPEVGDADTQNAELSGRWLCPIFGLRREALLVRVEVRDLRLRPVAAGCCSRGQPDPRGGGEAGAALTKPGRPGTARPGRVRRARRKGVRGEPAFYVLHPGHRLEPGGSGPGAARTAARRAAGTSGRYTKAAPGGHGECLAARRAAERRRLGSRAGPGSGDAGQASPLGGGRSRPPV